MRNIVFLTSKQNTTLDNITDPNPGSDFNTAILRRNRNKDPRLFYYKNHRCISVIIKTTQI